MFHSKVFTAWFFAAIAVWALLFWQLNSLSFLAEYWYYPAVMVVGAFVAGLTPEGGGAVAFPTLNVFMEVDRGIARDFSLMIQSIGMTSASIFLLTRPGAVRRDYAPLLWYIPVCFAGFLIGLETLQAIPVYLIQALFLSLITSFVTAYFFSDHRGRETHPHIRTMTDTAWTVAILLTGGLAASLFGTGADIILYTLLVTRFHMQEKLATHYSIMLMAAVSVLGFAWRGLVEQDISNFQIRTWLNAYPVVLFMAPFGALILTRINVEWMLKGLIALNVMQLAYFNLNGPSLEKFAASAVFSLVLGGVFFLSMRHVAAKARERAAAANA
ncbi:MAG: sulfite exporter TauE/SafE family protein [Hyphomonas sp.]|uniref:TSUP family transporter n=1 Tax=Hyphomonas sp. TaxID=87 RepID=UPI003527F46C